MPRAPTAPLRPPGVTFVAAFFVLLPVRLFTSSVFASSSPLSPPAHRYPTSPRPEAAPACAFSNGPRARPLASDVDVAVTAPTPPLPLRAAGAVLSLSYDGTNFDGFSSANDLLDGKIVRSDGGGGRRSRRAGRNQNQRSSPAAISRRRVRSIEGTVRTSLARLHGGIDVRRVRAQSSCRTDSGVHGRGAHLHFFVPEPGDAAGLAPYSEDDKNPDSCLGLPFGGDLAKLTYVLNRMLPPDVRVLAASRPPAVPPGHPRRYFHASRDAVSKTYRYTLSSGPVHDPLRYRHVWRAGRGGTRGFDAAAAVEAARVLEGHQDFSAYQGAPSGSARGSSEARRDTQCTVRSVRVEAGGGDGGPLDPVDGVTPPPPHSLFDPPGTSAPARRPSGTAMVWGGASSSGPEYVSIVVTGDRFLYKMVR